MIDPAQDIASLDETVTGDQDLVGQTGSAELTERLFGNPSKGAARRSAVVNCVDGAASASGCARSRPLPYRAMNPPIRGGAR